MTMTNSPNDDRRTLIHRIDKAILDELRLHEGKQYPMGLNYRTLH